MDEAVKQQISDLSAAYDANNGAPVTEQNGMTNLAAPTAQQSTPLETGYQLPEGTGYNYLPDRYAPEVGGSIMPIRNNNEGRKGTSGDAPTWAGNLQKGLEVTPATNYLDGEGIPTNPVTGEPATPAEPTFTPTTWGPSDLGQVNSQYSGLVGDNTQYINDLYAANREAALAQLQGAYDINRSNYEAEKAKIDAQYNTAANDLAVQYERNRRNALEQANINGLNTGVGSQMALAQNSAYQRDFGTLRGQQSAAQVEQDRLIANLEATYQNEIRQALANNDAERAAALLDEMNRQISQNMNVYQMQYQQAADRAAILAAGGDFSGYAALFGLSDDQQGLLAAQWIAANPDVAYDSGMIDADQYKAIVGKYPKGYKNGGGGGTSSGIGTKKQDDAGVTYEYTGGVWRAPGGEIVSDGHQNSGNWNFV